MEINRRENSGIVILDINGEIDLYNAPDIKDTIKQLIDEEKRQIIITLKRSATLTVRESGF